MIKVEFEYADALSNWEWRKSTCIVDSIAQCKEQCKKIYGLGDDCKFNILSVEDKSLYGPIICI